MSNRSNIKSNIVSRCINGNTMKLRISTGFLDDHKTILVPIRQEDDIDNLIETLEKMREYL
jgi:hypothetical protein